MRRRRVQKGVFFLFGVSNGIVQVHQQPPALFPPVYRRKAQRHFHHHAALRVAAHIQQRRHHGHFRRRKNGVVPRPLNGKGPFIGVALLFEIPPQLRGALSHFHLARADPAELRAQVFQNRFIIALHKIGQCQFPCQSFQFLHCTLPPARSLPQTFAASPYRSIVITSAACAMPFSLSVSLSSR